jgi:hypothetical protein
MIPKVMATMKTDRSYGSLLRSIFRAAVTNEEGYA